MAAEIFASLVAASSAVVIAGASYWFTKKRERDAELRKEKLEHYKDFVAALSSIVSGEGNDQDQRAFARASNKLNLIPPQPVLGALQTFQQEIKTSNAGRSTEMHDRLMSRLFYEIRKDLGVVPSDKEASFRVGLWASGTPRAPSSPSDRSETRT